MNQTVRSSAGPQSATAPAGGAPARPETQADATLTGVPEPLSDAAPGSVPLAPALRPDEVLSTPPVEAPTREDRIRQLAYERYLQRDGGAGDAASDWLAAEAELADEER